MQCPRSVEGSRQQGEIRLGEFLSPPEQAHDDKEISIGKKRTPEFRHRDRIRHRGDNSYGKDADRKIGGPRYLLCALPSLPHHDSFAAKGRVQGCQRKDEAQGCQVHFSHHHVASQNWSVLPSGRFRPDRHPLGKNTSCYERVVRPKGAAWTPAIGGPKGTRCLLTNQLNRLG